MGKQKQKLNLHQESQPLSNLFGALDGLDVSGLPEGKDLVPVPAESAPEIKGKGPELILRRETAGRAGKAVIVVSRFPDSMADDDLVQCAGLLKKHCGTGGTVKGREVEIQGDLAGKVADHLRKEGFRVRGLGV